MTKITKALIIDEPWITRIINGEKDWEMRSFSTRIRGPIGLIRKGSLQVAGVANMTNVSGAYDNEALIANTHHHTIPSEMFDDPEYKWRHAWELTEVKPLSAPVRYVHKNGAVIWVDLDEEAIKNIAWQLSDGSAESYLTEAEPVEDNKQHVLDSVKVQDQKILEGVTTETEQETVKEEQTETVQKQLKTSWILVPKAQDGSIFSRDTCNNKGIYTVGNKGDERKFSTFHEALEFLESMSLARWRRPNANGNFGIVSAVDWVNLK